MPLNTRITAKVGANLTSTPALSTASAIDLTGALEYLLASGTAAGQADRIYTASGTINASTTLSLDIATGGGLLAPDGAAVAMAKIKAILVKNTHATQGLSVSRPAAGVAIFTAASDAVPVPAGGCLLLFAPGLAGLATVTATTADLIDLVNGAGSSVTYEVVIIGTSA